MRTTIDIDDPILEEVRRLKEKEERSLGALVSELLAEGLAVRRERRGARAPTKFWWPSQKLGAKIDYHDKEALWAVLDEEQGYPHR